MYLYSGFGLFYYPYDWYGFLPNWFSQLVSQVAPVEAYLRLQGAGEFLIGLLFLAWFSGVWGLRAASILATVEIAFILLFVGIDLITFRDIGLLGGAIAILIISFGEEPPVRQVQG